GKGATGEVVRLSACDPLNVVGVITPGPRIPATLANTVLFRDGVPITDDSAPPLVRKPLPLAGEVGGEAAG
ncbi:MAG TPA: hypothetical protein VMU50_06085, partial [Polyangia bacterium]|nr:hypothetical protein [Polyangia bacterium]